MKKICRKAFLRAAFGAILLIRAVPAGAVERELERFLASPVTLALAGYERWVSAAKGTSCPMAPSDSGYARQAIRRYGAFKGSLLAIDRLNRCGHDLEKYPLVETAAGLKRGDPLR